jgi:hypothetical protein
MIETHLVSGKKPDLAKNRWLTEPINEEIPDEKVSHSFNIIFGNKCLCRSRLDLR